MADARVASVGVFGGVVGGEREGGAATGIVHWLTPETKRQQHMRQQGTRQQDMQTSSMMSERWLHRSIGIDTFSSSCVYVCMYVCMVDRNGCVVVYVG